MRRTSGACSTSSIDSSSSITVENLIQIMGSPNAAQVIAEADLTGGGVIRTRVQAAHDRAVGDAAAPRRRVGRGRAAPEGKEEGKRVAFA